MKQPDGSALPEWMNTPEKRRRIWAWQALAAAFTGDQEHSEECKQHALREDAKCASPVAPNAGTQRPGTPDGSLATETRKPGSLK